MKRILLLLAIFCLPIAVFAQGSCSPDKIALKDTGRPAGGASIRICPAGSTFPSCSASLFTDPTLGTPLVGSPVVTADALGNWGFCAAAGVNYDYQITCSGCTTLTVRNFPLPPTTPIAAAALTSSSANPANVGAIKLASGDCIDWRNNANTGNIQLCKTTTDALDLTSFSAVTNLVVNPSSTGTGAALTVGGTSPSTGGISVFVGALGAQNERLAIAPADGSSAAVRVGSLSVRSASGGFLAGTENASISNAGAIVGASATIGGAPVVTTTATQTLTSKTLISPIIGTGISQGSGYKHQRFGSTCTTAASSGTTCTTTLTWTAAFADANYTPVCSAVSPSNGTAFFNISSWSSASVVVILTSSGLANTFGGVNCEATHD